MKKDKTVTGFDELVVQFLEQTKQRQRNKKKSGRRKDAPLNNEELIKKLILYVAQNIQQGRNGGFNTTPINVAILKILVERIEAVDPDALDYGDRTGKLKCAILHERAQKVFGDKQEQLARLGAAQLVLEALSHLDDQDMNGRKTFEAVLELGAKLLENGNRDVQDRIFSYFKRSRTGHVFFQSMSIHLRALQNVLARDPAVLSKPQDGVEKWTLMKQPLILSFLRLWCEGHNHKMQCLLLNQDGVNRKSFNLLADAARSLDKLTANTDLLPDCGTDALAAIQAHLEFFVELLQGPCRENQDFVAEETTVVPSVRRLLKMLHVRLFHGRDHTLVEKKNEEPGWTFHFHDPEQQILLVAVLAQSCRLLQALIEARGGEYGSVHQALADALPVELFKAHTKRVHLWLQMLDGKPVDLENGHGERELLEDSMTELINEDSDVTQRQFCKEQLARAGFDLYSVSTQLGAIDRNLLRQLTPKVPKQGGEKQTWKAMDRAACKSRTSPAPSRGGPARPPPQPPGQHRSCAPSRALSPRSSRGNRTQTQRALTLDILTLLQTRLPLTAWSKRPFAWSLFGTNVWTCSSFRYPRNLPPCPILAR